jgi:regulator of CtrA degradation
LNVSRVVSELRTFRAGPEPAEAEPSRNVTAALHTVTYFDSTFDEALKLTREARDYLAYQEKADLSELSPVGRMAASCETMRMTARLTQIVAWLLVQKAVHAGELTREDAAEPKYRLAGQEVCDDTEPLAVEPLPERLSELLERSHRMYLRIARLDAMFDGHHSFTG